ncbi:MAG: hypothetical protein ACQXXJ_08610, partial [Candidatus Bathyarchaeia archaeon]
MEGMLILNIGLSHGMISSDLYTGMMLFSIITTILTPLILKPLYMRARVQQRKQDQDAAQAN